MEVLRREKFLFCFSLYTGGIVIGFVNLTLSIITTIKLLLMDAFFLLFAVIFGSSTYLADELKNIGTGLTFSIVSIYYMIAFFQFIKGCEQVNSWLSFVVMKSFFTAVFLFVLLSA